MMLRTTKVENNHTGKPMVNPINDNVAIYGAPAFPKGGNGPGFPSGGRPVFHCSVIYYFLKKKINS